MKKLFTKVDLIIVATALVLGISLLLFKPSASGKTAKIYVDGKEYQTIDLENTDYLEITVSDVVIICESNEIYIKSSSCPDKICVNAGHLSKKGQSAVCVPNRVSVEILGEKEGTVGAVTG